MVQDIVIEAVCGQNVPAVVLRVDAPVLMELLGSQHQHAVVSQLIVLDNRQRREGLAQADTIGNDAAIILFNFINGTHDTIFLELVEFVPDYSVLDAGTGLENIVLCQFPKVLVKHMIESDKINEFRGIFFVKPLDLLQYTCLHIFHGSAVIPELIKQFEEVLGEFTAIHAHIAVHTVRVGQTKAICSKVYRSIDTHRFLAVVDVDHAGLGGILVAKHFDIRFGFQPFGTFFCHGCLAHLIAELHLVHIT